jgi:hypothetical protein
VQNNFGPIALIGSGETSLVGGRIFENFARRLPQPLRVVILETPAGFELNSQKVAGSIANFLETRLQNFCPQIDILPARKRGTYFSTDEPSILQPLLLADLIFMGPGSPTYAVRQLKDSLAWNLIRARHRLGAGLILASAAAVAVGAYSLPVYEVYKVGEDVRIIPGLNLFEDFHLPVSIIPHWNNTDGGDEVDTSRCFIGIERFHQWCNLLPSKHTILGLDEHTGIIIDFSAEICSVNGVSSVTLQRANNSEIFQSGAEFPIKKLGEFHQPVDSMVGISSSAIEMIKNGVNVVEQGKIPAEVAQLAERRILARLRYEWAEADVLRRQIVALGWTVQDTPEGQRIIRLL